jgi:hypothetical protein
MSIQYIGEATQRQENMILSRLSQFQGGWGGGNAPSENNLAAALNDSPKRYQGMEGMQAREAPLIAAPDTVDSIEFRTKQWML